MKSLKDTLIPKLKATFIHLSLSLLVFLVVLYFILFEWYPEPFFTAQGGWQGIKLISFVQLVLGPCLTLIVYNHLKSRKALLLDISLIVLVQMGALIWGGYQVYLQRPMALVFWADAFYTVTQDDYSSQGINNPDFSQYSSYIPPLIYSRALETQAEMENSIELSNRLIPAYAHVAFYEKIEDNLKNVFHNEVNIEDVILENATMKFQLEKMTGGDIARYKYVALKAKYHNLILVMDENGKLMGKVKTPHRD